MLGRDRSVAELAQVFRILGDASRLRILLALQQGEMNVTELCRRLKAPQPTVSRHLAILRMGGLAVNRRSGKQMYYALPKARTVKGALRGLLKDPSTVHLGLLVLRLLNG